MTDQTTDDRTVVQLRAVEAPDETALDDAQAPAYAVTTDLRAGQRRPIVAEEWQRPNIRGTLGRHKELAAYLAKYHGLRTHLHLGAWLWCALVGAKRVTARVLTWWRWPNGHTLESLAVAKGAAGHHEAMNAHREGKRTRAAHGRILAVDVFLAAGALTAMVVFAPWWLWAALALAVFVSLVRAGKPEGRPIVRPAVLPTGLENLTSDVIVRALGALGLGEMNKAIREGRDVPMWIGRDGPGWRADVDLPHGVTPEEVMDKRGKLASGLRRNVGCVWPSAASEQHAGRLALYVADVAMSKAKQQPWPLARSGAGNVFAPQPFGTDQRGKVVNITMIFESMLIGSIPRQGKTGAMRVIALSAALDPVCEMHAHDLKGTGDLAAVKRVAHRYSCGADEETLAECMESVREVHGYLTTRAKTIAGLDSTICPDKKVTPELSARRPLKLHPVGLFIDEIQELFESAYAKEAETLLLALLKRGPAMGIFLVMATQRPDAKSLPKAISANAGIRFCLRIVDEASNNMILGAGMYAAGVRATMFTIDDKGVGWLAGQASDPQVTRTFYMNAAAADKICDRARAVRAGAGLLTGQAAGDDDPARRFAADVLSVFGGDAKLYTTTIAGRLAGQLPGVYADTTPEAVASQLRAAQVPVKQLREAGGAVRAGCERGAVLAVVETAPGA